MESEFPVQRQDEGGDAACWLAWVCAECGAMMEAPISESCWRCGTAPARPDQR